MFQGVFYSCVSSGALCVAELAYPLDKMLLSVFFIVVRFWLYFGGTLYFVVILSWISVIAALRVCIFVAGSPDVLVYVLPKF
ncbi:MAG: hypothetical protein WCH65_07225 [bacterium]